MKPLIFSVCLTLGLLFFYIAGFSGNYRGFRVALILGLLFLYLALISR